MSYEPTDKERFDKLFQEIRDMRLKIYVTEMQWQANDAIDRMNIFDVQFLTDCYA